MPLRLNNQSVSEKPSGEPVSSAVSNDPTLKRADLHVHSRFSVFKYFKRANTRDCYNAPEDVYRFAKEITVLVQGAVLVEGAPDAIMNNEQVRAVYLGQDGHRGPAQHG